MTLDQLRVFVAVAEELHVTRAARRLNMTQSAASAAIAALEARCATRLFHRVGRHIELSEPGRLFLAEARAVLMQATAAERVLNDLAGVKRGTLAIHASQTVGNYWLPPILHRFRSRFPDVALRFAIGNTTQVAAAVREGTADLGFVEGDVADPALAVRPVARDEMVLVVGADHPWAGRTAIRVAELADTPWVLREAGSGTRAIFEAALRDHGLDPAGLRVAFELPSNEAVRAAVRAGAGATVISALVVEPGIRGGLLHQIPFDWPERPFLVLRHKERYQSAAEKALLDMIA